MDNPIKEYEPTGAIAQGTNNQCQVNNMRALIFDDDLAPNRRETIIWTNDGIE